MATAPYERKSGKVKQKHDKAIREVGPKSKSPSAAHYTQVSTRGKLDKNGPELIGCGPNLKSDSVNLSIELRVYKLNGYNHQTRVILQLYAIQKK